MASILDLPSGNTRVGGEAPDIPFFAREEVPKRRARRRRRRRRGGRDPVPPPTPPTPTQETQVTPLQSALGKGSFGPGVFNPDEAGVESLTHFAVTGKGNTLVPLRFLTEETRKSLKQPLQFIDTSKLTPAERKAIQDDINTSLKRRKLAQEKAEKAADREIEERRKAGDERFLP